MERKTLLLARTFFFFFIAVFSPWTMKIFSFWLSKITTNDYRFLKTWCEHTR